MKQRSLVVAALAMMPFAVVLAQDPPTPPAKPTPATPVTPKIVTPATPPIPDLPGHDRPRRDPPDLRGARIQGQMAAEEVVAWPRMRACRG